MWSNYIIGGTILLLFALQVWGASWVVRKTGFDNWDGFSKPVSDFLYQRGVKGFINDLITLAFGLLQFFLLFSIPLILAGVSLFLTGHFVEYLFGVLI